MEDGHEKVIANMSKSLNKHEQLYCTTREELLAVVTALRTVHSYLYGQKTLVRTDNPSVSWIKQLKCSTVQKARWVQELGTYNLIVVHRAGLKLSNTDALFRRPCKVFERQERLSAPDSDDECDTSYINTLWQTSNNQRRKYCN